MYVSLRRSENSPRMMGAKDGVGGSTHIRAMAMRAIKTCK